MRAKTNVLHTIAPLIHLLARTEAGPGEPDLFAAHCGYTSSVRKEFTNGKLVGCVECRHKAGWFDDEAEQGSRSPEK